MKSRIAGDPVDALTTLMNITNDENAEQWYDDDGNSSCQNIVEAEEQDVTDVEIGVAEIESDFETNRGMNTENRYHRCNDENTVVCNLWCAPLSNGWIRRCNHPSINRNQADETALTKQTSVNHV